MRHSLGPVEGGEEEANVEGHESVGGCFQTGLIFDPLTYHFFQVT